jgi:hypothetical protein
MTTSRGFQRTLVIVLLLATGGASAYLHLQNLHLRRRIERQEPSQSQGARLRDENARLHELVTSHARDMHAAAATVRIQLEETRREIATVEASAMAQRFEDEARALREANALATQRDPTSGMTRLEHFRDLGQGTPSAAFETLVHAALKGDEVRLAKLLTVPAKTRTQADALIARLPAEARAQWSAEKLTALWITGAATELSALRITSERFDHSNSAVVTFRGPQFTTDEKVNLKLTPEGWKIVVGSGMIANLEKKLAAQKPPTR